MTTIQCQYAECTYSATHASEPVAIAMYNNHTTTHNKVEASAPPQTPAKQRLPNIDRPELKQDISYEDWATFESEWKRFKRCTKMDASEVADQLFQCAERSLQRLLLKENSGIIEEGEEALLEAMKKMAVIQVATSVRRANLLSHKQDHGEPFREFYANVRSSACTCNFNVKCPHACCREKAPIDYTSQVVKDVLISGIADAEIRKDVLGWSSLDEKTDKEIVAFVEEKEIARNALSGSTTAATSGYRKRASQQPLEEKSKRIKLQPKVDQEEKRKLALKGKCPTCQTDYNLYTRFRSGQLNKEAFLLCQKCHKTAKAAESETGAIVSFVTAVEGAHTTCQVSSISDDQTTVPYRIFRYACGSLVGGLLAWFFYLFSTLITGLVGWCMTMGGCLLKYLPFGAVVVATSCTSHCAPLELSHHIFTRDGWERANSLHHPTLNVQVSTSVDDYSALGYPFIPMTPKSIDVVADTGAQSCLWSRRAFLRCGLTIADLIPVNHNMKAANSAPIEIDGAILLRLSGQSSSGKSWEARVMVYISPQANSFFLSKEAMVQLGVIPPSFPSIGSTIVQQQSDIAAARTNSTPAGKPAPCKSGVAECGCPVRTVGPDLPQKLPFTPTENNIPAMKSYMLDKYASSVFNQCPHQELPSIDAPAMKFHVNVKDMKPVCLKTPASIPLHWQDQVYAELERDIALGVIEKVPYGEPITWCFRMVISRKHDGSPRRTVDLSPLNKFCEREVHPSQSPFRVVHSIPPGSVKTVFDAWNGFHLVMIPEEDRQYTNFSTPWGIYRYKRAPQGYLASGDGFTRRFDELVMHFERLGRIIDDSCLYDPADSLETHWWRALKFLDVCAKSGVVLNMKKFQFSQLTVDFGGFRISSDTVEPLPKYLDAIRNYPTPKNITDIRSWFGLVNQVSHYSQLRLLMEPFRPFLSPKVEFVWTDELNQLFELSKVKIVDAIQEGVRIFDLGKMTALSTDYSKTGIGFWLLQRHCSCETIIPGCCIDGWRIVLAGSRFLSRTESNYCPLEGEALGVAWALEQTRYFTLGCNELVIVVDHEPLVKILGDRRLDEIDNPRMFRLKQRTLMWRFRIVYRPGKKNDSADAISRHPNPYAELASLAMQTDEDRLEESYICGVISDLSKFFAITWERIAAESKKDSVIRRLVALVYDGFPKSKSEMPAELSEFWEFRSNLRVVEDCVVVYKDRIVVPSAFRQRILQNLHSAEQGVSSMSSRAQCTVFWPGLSRDIEAFLNS